MEGVKEKADLITLGLDPEFLFVDKKGDVKSAYSLLSRGNKFGCDGCSTLAELRPSPHAEPEKVVSNMHRIMKNTSSRKPQVLMYDWRAGTYYKSYSLGGHIHIGHPDLSYLSGSSSALAREGFAGKIATAFDVYLATEVLLKEDIVEAEQRRVGSYGHWGAYRMQQWGVEYRTLPSFIVSPLFTEGILSIAKVLSYEVLYNGGDYIKSNSGLKFLFERNNKMAIKDKLLPIRETMKTFTLYPTYKTAITKFYNLVDSNMTLNSFPDIKEPWGINKLKSKLKMLEPKPIDAIWQELTGEVINVTL